MRAQAELLETARQVARRILDDYPNEVPFDRVYSPEQQVEGLASHYAKYHTREQLASLLALQTDRFGGAASALRSLQVRQPRQLNGVQQRR